MSINLESVFAQRLRDAQLEIILKNLLRYQCLDDVGLSIGANSGLAAPKVHGLNSVISEALISSKQQMAEK